MILESNGLFLFYNYVLWLSYGSLGNLQGFSFTAPLRERIFNWRLDSSYSIWDDAVIWHQIAITTTSLYVVAPYAACPRTHYDVLWLFLKLRLVLFHCALNNPPSPSFYCVKNFLKSYSLSVFTLYSLGHSMHFLVNDIPNKMDFLCPPFAHILLFRPWASSLMMQRNICSFCFIKFCNFLMDTNSRYIRHAFVLLIFGTPCIWCKTKTLENFSLES